MDGGGCWVLRYFLMSELFAYGTHKGQTSVDANWTHHDVRSYPRHIS